MMNDSNKGEQSELAHSAERENYRPKGKKIINPWRNHEGYNCFWRKYSMLYICLEIGLWGTSAMEFLFWFAIDRR